MAREEFQYAVLQVVPRVERGERFNAGVVLYCRRAKFLAARTHLDPAKLTALAPGADPAEIEGHLEALAHVAAGDPRGGPNAALDAQDRFGFLAAPSSTVIQPGPTHTGLTDDPQATLERLFAELVGEAAAPGAVAPDTGAAAARVAELESSLAGSEQRFEAILGALAESVTIRSPDHRIIYANPAAVASLGYESLDALRQADLNAMMDQFSVTGEDGNPLRMEDIPSVRLLRGETPDPLLMRSVHRVTGEEKWQLLKAAPLRSPAGEIEATVTIIEDVTSARRAQLRAQFLARAGELLSGSLDYASTLRAVAELAVPDLADWCAVDLVDERGQREQLVVAHANPLKLAIAAQLRKYQSRELDPTTGVGRVIASGEPELYADVTPEMLAPAAVDEEHLALLLDLGVRSVLIVPMTAGGTTLGAVTLISAESGRRFDESEVEFARQVAERAAVAVVNAQLSDERAMIAETLQRSLLPDALPSVPGWEVAALYRPAGQHTQVGGDFYDVIGVEDSWVALIGDVTGKGVQAAAMTSLLRHSARIVAEEDPDPAQVLRRLDRVLRSRDVLSIATALCTRLDGDRVTLSLAGHPPPLLVRSDTVETIGRPGTALGIVDDGEWDTDVVTLAPGDTIVLFTDGVTDTVGENGRFGLERLCETVVACAGQPAADMLAHLDEALTRFQVGPQADDTAALVLRRAP